MVMMADSGEVSWSELGEGEEDQGSEGELDEHVYAGDEEGESEVEMPRAEHPFVVLGED